MSFPVFCLLAHLVALNGVVAFAPGEIYNTQKETIPLLKPEEALQKMLLSPGFKATLFAAEPALEQPIGMTFDSRGRLWVAENYTYAEGKLNFDTDLSDRILIFEDTDHDGRHDSRKVFWDGAKKLTSVAVGFGGVFAMCPPQLLFIPDRNHDDVPDGPPEVLLDGFDHEKIRHTLANGLKFGPDGWLYGRHGIQGTSFVGQPGARERVTVNGSIWRYHPVRHVFELVAQGTTNPWGSDWDENGELFFINTVIGHLWHAIPGAYFKRMYGQPFDPHVYEEIDQVADHVHWDAREAWNAINKGMSASTEEAGGGHAHTGLMMYLGDNWPEEYRNTLFTLNFHGKRINHDIIAREGASYVGHHAPDFMRMSDPYFRGIDLLYGPDGGVYVSDWSDIGECHDQDGIHRTSGRIYRITYGEPTNQWRGDLAQLSNPDLVGLLGHRNEWFVRQARLVLQERAAAGADLADTAAKLRAAVTGAAETHARLRALWALYSMGAAEPALLESLLKEGDEHLRVWAIRLLVDFGAPSRAAVEQFAAMAEQDTSGLVLCYLASALQRIPVEQRWPIARALTRRGEFEGDRVLPLMTWYGIEGAIPAAPEKAVDLVRHSRFRKVRELAARRIFEDLETFAESANAIVQFLQDAEGDAAAILRGIAAALETQREPVPPKAWASVAPVLFNSRDEGVRELARELDALFGSAASQVALRTTLLNVSAEPSERRRALKLLEKLRPPGTVAALEQLVGDKDLSAEAVRGLAAIGSPHTSQALLARYDSLDPKSQREVVNALVSRPDAALALVQAVQRGKIKKGEINASALRELRQHDDNPELTSLVELIWPNRANSNDAKAQLFTKYRALLSGENLKHGDLARGRAVFQTTCGVCHKLYGEGAAIGPELTGSDRGNLDYLLENILAPSSIVPDAYRASIVSLKDDRVLTGILLSQTDQAITLQTQSERMTLPRSEIDSIRESQLSMMPDGLLDALTEQQTLDLVSYLMSTK